MKEAVPTMRWRDPEGNTYGVEKAVRNGRFVVIRTNPGGNRKGAKQFNMVVGNFVFVQGVLNMSAATWGWQAVTP